MGGVSAAKSRAQQERPGQPGLSEADESLSRAWISAPHRLQFEDGFADDNGNPNPDMPTISVQVSIDEEESGGTRMTIESTFLSLEAMEQLVEMGMEEGFTEAVGQIDDLLSEDNSGAGA